MQRDQEEFDQAAIPYEQSGCWEPLTLGEHLKVWAATYQDRVALVDEDARLTYQELDRKADELAAGFFTLGIKAGDRVVVQLPNRSSFVVACFALFRMGAVPVLALPAHRETELDGIFSLAKPVAYIIPVAFLGFDYKKMADQLVKKHPSVAFLITDGRSENAFNLADIRRSPLDLAGPSHRDVALLLLSGGTTATPKLIPRTHADYAYNAKAAAARCKLTPQSVYLAVLPVAHNFPLCCPGILGTLSVGGKVVLCKTTSADEALPLIEKERVTITALVPALVKLWLEVLAWDASGDISSLEVLQVGGAMLDENLAKPIMPVMQCKLQQVFGMAEGLICCTALDDPEHIIHSCQGRPISAEDEIRIVDEDGRDVAPGQYGELLARGPYTIRGYYRASAQNHRDFTPDGFYRSGDQARITSEGNIQIGGRIKEQINRAGEKITPAEIESYLCLHPDISDAAVLGLPDDSLGERSCAYVMSDKRDISLTDIHQLFHDLGVARYKMPDQLERIDDWPLTSAGKVDKVKLKAMALGRDSQAKEVSAFYLEETIAFAGDAHWLAVQLLESGFFATYLLYENQEELALGLGVHALVSVDCEATILTTADKTLSFENERFSETMARAFAAVRLKNWRAYGTVNFGLARYRHGLPLLSEEKCRLKLFIPEVEVRFTPNSIRLRALTHEHLEQFGQLVKTLLHKGHDESHEKSLAERLAGRKLEAPWVNTHHADEYMTIVADAVQEIRERNYQKVILSRKIPLHQELDMAASYMAGRKVNSPARSFLLSFDGLHAAGFSPETVVEVDSQGWVSTQPLAGTRACGGSEEEERRLKEELLDDPKEIAEHAVSVKLAFEELQSICELDSIAVNDFMSIARRGTVQHIASRLKGKLRPGCNAWQALYALFPAVTASGIPKKESIAAIGRLETQPRNLYSGCVMTFDSDGTMDAALVLRTIFQKNQRAWLHTGAGVVAMSSPARELEETREKLSSYSRQLVVSSRATGERKQAASIAGKELLS